MERLDAVVIGAGVVGLAVGRALAGAGRDVVVLEAESQPGTHASSRNSEVIHAGIYYPEGSLKARLCVRGKQMLYDYCEAHGVRHRNIGKLIVATTAADLDTLAAIQAGATRNDVRDLELLDAAAVERIEPNVECVGALLSPSTGIIDSHEFMLSLQADLEALGGAVVCNSRVTAIDIEQDGFGFATGDDRFACKSLVNAAGLWAGDIASMMSGLSAPPPDIRYAIGHYFSYQGMSPFNHLVYPVPADGGLGIHATNDMGGALRFGPDVSWIDAVDYAFDASRKTQFVAAVRSYFPQLDEAKLSPAYTGIRPKLYGPGEPATDFVVQSPAEHGVRNLVNLFGIESPGLTSSLALAEFVAEAL